MKRKQHKTQEARILELLVRAHGAWVPAPELAAVSLQYSSRVFSLRRAGLAIENKIENASEGSRRGYFRLRVGLPAAVQGSPKQASNRALFTSDELRECERPSGVPDGPPSRFEVARMRRHG